MASPSMDRIAAKFAPQGFQSLFIYVREAHPGENYPHHDSRERKLHHAREFKRIFNCDRRILVDDLTGTLHRAFGRLPNMTFILSQTHSILFRSGWTDAATVEFALDYLLRAQGRRHEGMRLAPFYAELQGFRTSDPACFLEGLELAGPKAVTEFRSAQERWARGEHLGSIKK